MKKYLYIFILFGLIIFCLNKVDASGKVYNNSLQDSISWLYNNQLSIYNEPNSFMANDYLTREQASKFFAKFAGRVAGSEYTNDINYDIFKDIKNATSDLKYYIIQANYMGLFKGSNGNFMPFSNLTKAQAIAVSMRIIFGNLDETTNPRYTNYYLKAKEIGIIGDAYNTNNLDKENITRGEMAIILYNLYNYVIDNLGERPFVAKLIPGENPRYNTQTETNNSKEVPNNTGNSNNEETANKNDYCNDPNVRLACDIATCPEECKNYSYEDSTTDSFTETKSNDNTSSNSDYEVFDKYYYPFCSVDKYNALSRDNEKCNEVRECDDYVVRINNCFYNKGEKVLQDNAEHFKKYGVVSCATIWDYGVSHCRSDYVALIVGGDMIQYHGMADIPAISWGPSITDVRTRRGSAH